MIGAQKDAGKRERKTPTLGERTGREKEKEKGRKGEREKGRKGEREKGRKGERERENRSFFLTSCNARAAHIKQDSISSKTCGKRKREKDGVAASLFSSAQRGARKFVAVMVSSKFARRLDWLDSVMLCCVPSKLHFFEQVIACNDV